MKKITLSLLALVCAIACAVGLVACGEKHTHEWSEIWSSDATYHWHVCSGCDGKESFAEHSFGAWIIQTEATETTVGSQKRVCEVCNYAQTEEIPVKEHVHTYAAEYTYNENEHWRVATCGHNEETDRGGHTMNDGECSVCGYVDVATIYDFTENGTGYTIAVKESEKERTSFTIPERYKGKPITEIAEEGFSKIAATALTIPASVKAIGDYAFWKSSIEQITIPDTVETIGALFYQCDSLKTVTLGNGITEIPANTFRETPELVTVNLGSNIQTIGKFAFYQCAVTSVTLPDSLQTMGTGAFMQAESLESVELGNGLTTIPEQGFYGCTKLTPFSLKNVTTIGNFAFRSCKAFKADIPAGMQIGEKAFQYSGIKSVVWNKKSASTNEFEDCTNLISVEFTDDVSTIAGLALKNCVSLKTVKFGKSVASIYYNAFENCTAIETLTVSEENEKYSAVDNALLNKAGTLLYLANAAGDIPATVTQIESYAFYGHKKITEFVCPEQIKFIKDYAFYGCENLTSVTLMPNPNKGASHVGSHAFANCPKLETVVIPDKVTYLGVGVFEGCANLKSVQFQNTNGWSVKQNGNATTSTPVDVSNATDNVNYFLDTYAEYSWHCST